MLLTSQSPLKYWAGIGSLLKKTLPYKRLLIVLNATRHGVQSLVFLLITLNVNLKNNKRRRKKKRRFFILKKSEKFITL